MCTWKKLYWNIIKKSKTVFKLTDINIDKCDGSSAIQGQGDYLKQW